MSFLQKPYSQPDFLEFLSKDFLSDYSSDKRPVRTPDKSLLKEVQKLGESESLGLSVFEAACDESDHGKRVAITMDAFRILRDTATRNALIAFYSKNTNNWRLSLLTSSFELDSKGKVTSKMSNPRRYSYLLGIDAKTVTPHKYLEAKGKVKDFKDLQSRFAVEVVNNDFYKEIAKLYDELVGTDKQTGLLKYPGHGEVSHQFAVRLIGRIIFCWFLREKRSEKGTPLIPQKILSGTAAKKDNYYHNELAPLFFEVLNKRGNSRNEKFQEGLYKTIPYLNGGLFNPDSDDHYKFDKSLQFSVPGLVDVPDKWLRSFFDLLELYNFTVDENTSYDVELSIDPEMLGRIFENLLARINPETGETVRKMTGSFYTPREIVEYMVDESLQQYLKTKTEIQDNKLSAVISFDLLDDGEFPLTENEKQQITDSLSLVKILDPACGSGAFPMGILQKIVFILQQVDPDSKKWIEKQLVGASPEFRHHLEREFENKNFNYLRKLGVIRESIYGVDIQPIATEISRLRCFLTLIVDQSVDDQDDNRGVEPLPNLDFKFVTANSLLQLTDGSDMESQTGLFEDTSGIDDLRNLRNEYFSSHNHERDSLKLQFSERQKQMLQNMIASHSSGFSDLTQKLSTWNPFSHKVTDWFDPDWMFGVNSGFNIVIGNPPYVSALKSVKDNSINRDQYRKIYKELSGAFDLYVAFVLRGLQLLQKEGVYSWIIPNKFSVASYARNAYDLLENSGLMLVVSVSTAKVFEASVYPIVILGKKHDEPLELKEYTAHTLNDLANPLSSNINTILSKGRYKLIGETNIKLASGATGFQAQLIKKHISDTPGGNKIPFTVSGCIDPYELLNKPVRYMGLKHDKAYVEKIGNDIAESKWKLWQNEKIVIAGMTKRLEAVYKAEPLGIGVGTYAIYEFGEYDKFALLAVLNSNFLSYFLKNKFKAKHLAGGYLAINKETLEQLPLPPTSPSDPRFAEIANYAQKILHDSLSTQEKSEYKKRIDNVVYELYDLNPEEIQLIESSE